MAWLNVSKAPLGKNVRRDIPEGLWLRCLACHEILYRKDFESNQHICMKCDHHYPIPAHERIRHFLDPQSFIEKDQNFKKL